MFKYMREETPDDWKIKQLQDKILEIAVYVDSFCAENGIDYAPEVMGGRTGTNADVLSVAESGAKTCTVSIPLRNMHTEVETISLADIESSAKLLAKYILSGGLLNA